MQGKITQGIPIGNDINPHKTRILELPLAALEEWQQVLQIQAKADLSRVDTVVGFFDTAFRLREQHGEAAVLTYALGLLFRLPRPSEAVASVVQGGVVQSILSEPGVAQKAFALLTYWGLNGLLLDRRLLTRTINQVIVRHATTGVTSDVSWALSFCLQHQLELGTECGRILASSEDDAIAIQALHCRSQNLIPKGFNIARIVRLLKSAEMDGEHWLVAYEAVRQGFMTESHAAVTGNELFKELLQQRVTFYRAQLPDYATVIHPGGAPEWMVAAWMDAIEGRRPDLEGVWTSERVPLLDRVRQDVQGMATKERLSDETVATLENLFVRDLVRHGAEEYAV